MPEPRTLSEAMTMPIVEPMEPMEIVEPMVPLTDTDLQPEVLPSLESPPADEAEAIEEGEAEVEDEYIPDSEVEGDPVLEAISQELGIIPVEVPVVEAEFEPQPELLQPPEHPVAKAIRAYCTQHSISLVLKALCEEVPEAMPNYRTWRVTSDPVVTIHGKIQGPGYVEQLQGPLDIMLGSNVSNIQWAARVVIAIAAYDVVRDLGNLVG